MGYVSKLVPTEVKVVWRSARPPRRRRLRLVAEGLRHVDSGRGESRSIGAVCAVAVVRNEQDILGDVLRHLAEQDVDSVVIADNRSDDATPEILQEWSTAFPMMLFEQRIEGHYQAETVTTLSRVAARAGAKWIVPFDADEFWSGTSRTLGAELRCSETPIRTAQIHNLFPVGSPDRSGSQEFRLDITPHVRGKVAFKTSRAFFVRQGNHLVERRGVTSAGLHVAHYPWRSLEQMSRKARVGRAAYEATDLDVSRGYHKRFLGGLSDQALAEVWQRVLAGEPTAGIEWSPVGPFSDTVDVRRFKCWNDVEEYLGPLR